MQSPDTAELLTVSQLCALLHMTPKTAQRWRLNGEGPPFVRPGSKTVLYRRSDVNAWLATRTFKHRAAEAVDQHAA